MARGHGWHVGVMELTRGHECLFFLLGKEMLAERNDN